MKTENGAKKVIGVKIGSSSLVGNKGRINRTVIKQLAKQTKKFLDCGHSVFIVTSGAVASARNDGWSKNLCSAVGQIRLMNMYAREFGRRGIIIAQALLTDRELEKENSDSIVDLMKESFSRGIVFIINANDAIDNEELKALEVCADNDRLFGLVSEKIQSDVAIIVFSEKGFRDDKGEMISSVKASDIDKAVAYAKGGSLLGHGNNGMSTKIKTLCRLAESGTQAMLVSVLEEDFLLRAVRKEENFGTVFVD